MKPKTDLTTKAKVCDWLHYINSAQHLQSMFEVTPTCCWMRSWKEAAGTAAWRWKTNADGALCTSSSSAFPCPLGVYTADSSRPAAKCPPCMNGSAVCFFFVEAVGLCTRAERGTAPKGLVSKRGLGLGGWDMVALTALVMFSGCSCMRERSACLFSATKRGVPPAAGHCHQHINTKRCSTHSLQMFFHSCQHCHCDSLYL